MNPRKKPRRVYFIKTKSRRMLKIFDILTQDTEIYFYKTIFFSFKREKIYVYILFFFISVLFLLFIYEAVILFLRYGVFTFGKHIFYSFTLQCLQNKNCNTPYGARFKVLLLFCFFNTFISIKSVGILF